MQYDSGDEYVGQWSGGLRHGKGRMVFEDRTPRVVDLDGDGANEVVAIRSSLSEGGGVAVYGLREGRLAELAVLIGAGEESEDPNLLSQKFIQAVRDLRTEVGIPDQMTEIRREDFEDITRLAIAEGALYPVPRLLDSDSVNMILNKIAC